MRAWGKTARWDALAALLIAWDNPAAIMDILDPAAKRSAQTENAYVTMGFREMIAAMWC